MKRLIKKLGLIFCISFIGMFALLVLFVNFLGRSPFSRAEYEPEQTADRDETAGAAGSDDAAPENEEIEPTDEERRAEEWGIRITSRARMDFHRVLLEEDYRLFTGSDVNEHLGDSFYFSYPKNLYYAAEAYADDTDERYRVSFRGKDNDALLYYSQEPYDRSAGDSSIDTMYEEDRRNLTDVDTIHHSMSVYVLTGLENDGTTEVYKVVKAEGDHLYTMLIKTPLPENEDTRTLLSFYTEYLYRSCGFSGSSKEPRSYAEFLLGEE